MYGSKSKCLGGQRALTGVERSKRKENRRAWWAEYTQHTVYICMKT